MGECFIAVPSPTETSTVRDRHVPSLTFTGHSFKPGSYRGEATANQDFGDREHWINGNLRINVLWDINPETGASLGPSVNRRKDYNARDYRVSRFSVDPLQQIGPAGSLSIRKLMVKRL